MEIFKCGIDLLIVERKKVITMVLISSVALLLIMSSIMIRVTSNYAYNELDTVLANGIDKAAKISVDEDIFSNSEIVSKINSIEGVTYFGTMMTYMMNEECFKELQRVQESYGTDILYMNPSLFKMCNTKLDCGTEYDELKKKGNTKYLYLGYDYRARLHYEVGDIFTDSLGMQYQIAGFLKLNQRIVQENLINEFSVGQISYSNNLDKTIICVDDAVFSNAFWLGIDKKHEINDVINTVREELNQAGYSSRFMTFTEMINKGMVDGDMMYGLISKLAIVVSCAAILMIISIFIVLLFAEQKRFGIMYAMGFYIEDIKNMIMVKNSIIVISSVILSNTIFKFIINKRYGNVDNEWVLNYLTGYYIYPKIIIGAIIFIVMTNFAVKKYLENKMPSDMLNERV